MAVVTMKNLLESGVHFGHQTRRWDPRMKKYIFSQRNGIHIVDLQKTIIAIKKSYEVVRQNVLAGKSVLFVGTKKQAQASVKSEAERCEMFYVNNRWLGGMLTNFTTIKKSLLRLKKLEKMEIDGTFDQLTKKEVARLLQEKNRLEKNLGGIKNMNGLPGVMFVIDTKKEAIAVAEARRMGIPIIAVVDTNCNPEGIDYPIPGNDDAIRAINLFTQVIANAVIEADNEHGLKVIETLQDEDEETDYPEGKPEDKEAKESADSTDAVNPPDADSGSEAGHSAIQDYVDTDSSEFKEKYSESTEAKGLASAKGQSSAKTKKDSADEKKSDSDESAAKSDANDKVSTEKSNKSTARKKSAATVEVKDKEEQNEEPVKETKAAPKAKAKAKEEQSEEPVKEPKAAPKTKAKAKEEQSEEPVKETKAAPKAKAKAKEEQNEEPVKESKAAPKTKAKAKEEQNEEPVKETKAAPKAKAKVKTTASTAKSTKANTAPKEKKDKDDKTMNVSPQDVKKLRDKTGAGMLDCKNALIKANGDFSAAEKVLKEQGLASADKRVGRATNNGSVFTLIENGKAAMAELTCETDFVAKNDVFRSAGEKIAAAVIAAGSAKKSTDIENLAKEAIAVLKENMLVGRIVYWDCAEDELVSSYAHNGGVIGVMVKLKCESADIAAKEEVKALAFDLALHAAAYNPAYLSRDTVDPAYIKEQEEIFSVQANNLGDKPENVLKGIVSGKMKKHLAQICFVEQGFVKENSKSVQQVIDETVKTVGGSIALTDYAYIAVGQE